MPASVAHHTTPVNGSLNTLLLGELISLDGYPIAVGDELNDDPDAV
jgi:hypothetical protein